MFCCKRWSKDEREKEMVVEIGRVIPKTCLFLLFSWGSNPFLTAQQVSLSKIQVKSQPFFPLCLVIDLNTSGLIQGFLLHELV